ncbi:hypothetical protein SVAN01_11349 [Stagonosporopsis vannaccii]|nr:hypothetical protein SVAN01_11349 [Stagonosporopsis vannaccii]
MLAIHPTSSKKCTPNLLPMRINHDGRIENTERYWTPTIDEKDVQHAHFRGRHLRGTPLPLPSHYTGAVINITDRIAPPPPPPQHTSHSLEPPNAPSDDDDEDHMVEDVVEEVKIAEQVGHFDSIVVWGHGGVVDREGDEFVRVVGEWVGFAEGMHCDDEEIPANENGKGNKAT